MTSRRPRGTGSVQDLGNGRWRIRVFVGIDPVTGKPRQASRTVHARNITEARRQVAQLQQDVGGQVIGTDATVRTVVDEWLRHSRARGRSPKTVHEAERVAEREVYPAFGDVKVSDLTPKHVDDWMAELGRRGLRPASIRRHHAVLRAALNQAVRWDWLERNPAERAEPPTPDQQTLRVPTQQQVRRLLDEAAVRNPGYGTLLALAVFTAARRGELCALRWTDLDELGGVPYLRIRRALWRAGAARGEKGTKGNRERWVPLAGAPLALLARWRQHCEQVAASDGLELAADGFIVSPWPDGTVPTNPDTLSAFVGRLARELGMAHIHLHSLRHFAATEMLAGGVDARNAAAVLGHADGGKLLLSTYAHATAERQAQAAEVLARALGPGVE